MVGYAKPSKRSNGQRAVIDEKRGSDREFQDRAPTASAAIGELE
jgi:hypothetical protein